MRSICRYESLEEHELGDDASGSGSHGQLPNGGGLTGPELLAELKREVTKQVIAESRQVIPLGLPWSCQMHRAHRNMALTHQNRIMIAMLTCERAFV